MSDLIDRQAVIDLLKQMRKDGDMVPWEGKAVFARIRKLPTIQPEERTEERTETHACDLISRQAAIDIFDDYNVSVENGELEAYSRDRKRLCELPTVQPERTEERTETHGVCLDAISRQEAIDAIDKKIKQCCKALGSLSLSDVDKHAVEVKMASLRAYREMLESLPTVQPEPQWIPVSERLPETEEFVLASLTGKYRNTTFEHACEIADYADGEWCVYAYPHMSAEKCAELIEAWMPLPTPYKPNK